MQHVVSTHVFLRQRLHPGLLDTIAASGAAGVEIFAARQHFDYLSRAHVQEVAAWFSTHPVQLHSMHAPLYPDLEMGRSGAQAVNVVHPDKSRRIDSMDEIKRALEVAELIPMKYLILHLGERPSSGNDGWNARTLEHSITAIEHLRAFARPLGVQLLVENIQNAVTAPANLVEIFTVGHFADVGVCLDTGHAHIMDGLPATLGILKPHILSTHIHDNHATRDEHLWPGSGTIDWPSTLAELRSAPHQPAAVLEIHYTLGEPQEDVASRAAAAFRFLEEA